MYLSHWEELKQFNDRIGAVVGEFMREQDAANIPTGRYELSDGCFVNVDEYETRENYAFEAHRKYIDVQILVDGVEEFFCAELDKGQETIAYDEKKDIAFYSCKEGDFYTVGVLPYHAIVLCPNDLHAPCNSKVVRKNRKLVFKIPIMQKN